MFAEECLRAKSQHLFWQIVSYFAEKVNTLFAFRGEISLKIAMHPVGRQPGDPSGEAALAPLKGELAARTG